MAGEIDLLADDVVIVLIAAGSSSFSAAHEFLSSVGGSARVKISAAIGSKSIGDGVFKAQTPFNIPDVPARSVEALIVAIDSGDDATSRLLVYINGDEVIDVAADAAESAVELPVEDLQTAVPLARS
jgi:hypothetical protein